MYRNSVNILLMGFLSIVKTPEEEEVLNKKRSKRTQKKYDERKKTAKISPLLEEQFQQGKLLGESEHLWSTVVIVLKSLH